MGIRPLPVFDAHLHIIDGRFPLVANAGFVPRAYTCSDYLARMGEYDLVGGAVVSGSFQAFDQGYLADALATLGPSFVGVTQLPRDVSDEELVWLDRMGVRGIRFNLRRGGSEGLRHLDAMANRVFDVVGWHAELYVDARELDGLYAAVVSSLPSASIDHLGLSSQGLGTVIPLAEKDVRVKATGFGRVDFDVAAALRDIYSANPSSLIFGTDLPSTRAMRPYSDEDFMLVIEALGEEAARRVCYENAVEFYRLQRH